MSTDMDLRRYYTNDPSGFRPNPGLLALIIAAWLPILLVILLFIVF